MAKVTFANEPNYELIKRAVQQLYSSMTPEQRKKYAHKGDDKNEEKDVELPPPHDSRQQPRSSEYKHIVDTIHHQ